MRAGGFFDTREQDPEAMKMLALIGKLYEVERQAAELMPEERRALREEKSLPVLEEIDRVREELAHGPSEVGPGGGAAVPAQPEGGARALPA